MSKEKTLKQIINEHIPHTTLIARNEISLIVIEWLQQKRQEMKESMLGDYNTPEEVFEELLEELKE